LPIGDLDTNDLLVTVAFAPFIAGVLAVVGHFEGVLTIAESSYQLSDYAVPASLVTLAGATVLGGRELGDMETWEQAAVAVALLVIGSSEYVPEVGSFIAENMPYASLGAAATATVAYYILAWRD